MIGLISGAVIAAPKNVPKSGSEVSASVGFVNLPGSRFDSAFNEEIFTDQARQMLNRSGIAIEGNTRRKHHLNFQVDYVYHQGEVEYRFASIRLSVRNKADHGVCEFNQSFWWGGPSGRTQLRNAAEESLNGFAKHCLKAG
ncbi:MAG: hypothetical protein ACRYF6_08045 [Janthinobacterium lividum]